jgi:hypothetical protein
LRRVEEAIIAFSPRGNPNVRRALGRLRRSIEILSAEVRFEGTSFIGGETGTHFQETFDVKSGIGGVG